MSLLKQNIFLAILLYFIVSILISVAATETLEFKGDFYEFNAHTAGAYDSVSICNISTDKGVVAYVRHNANSFVANVFTVNDRLLVGGATDDL